MDPLPPWASLMVQQVKGSPAMQATQETGSVLGLGRPHGGGNGNFPLLLEKSLVGYSPKGCKVLKIYKEKWYKV